MFHKDSERKEWIEKNYKNSKHLERFFSSIPEIIKIKLFHNHQDESYSTRHIRRWFQETFDIQIKSRFLQLQFNLTLNKVKFKWNTCLRTKRKRIRKYEIPISSISQHSPLRNSSLLTLEISPSSVHTHTHTNRNGALERWTYQKAGANVDTHPLITA